MFRIILTLTLVITSILLNAQEKKQFLEVDYLLEMKMDAEKIIQNVPPAFKAQIEAQLREEIKNGIFSDYKLQTNGTESVYKLQEKINNNQSQAGIIISQISASDKDPLYKNLNENVYIKPYSFMQNLLVKDKLNDFKWTISREKQKIAGFDALKATGTLNDSVQVVAWYTPKITVKDGPDRFWGLPGLILKAEFNMMDMEFIITAKNVNVLDKEIKIDRPSKGRVLNEKEFDAEVKAFQAKMKEMYGSGVDLE